MIVTHEPPTVFSHCAVETMDIFEVIRCGIISLWIVKYVLAPYFLPTVSTKRFQVYGSSDFSQPIHHMEAYP